MGPYLALNFWKYANLSLSWLPIICNMYGWLATFPNIVIPCFGCEEVKELEFLHHTPNEYLYLCDPGEISSISYSENETCRGHRKNKLSNIRLRFKQPCQQELKATLCRQSYTSSESKTFKCISPSGSIVSICTLHPLSTSL